MDLLSVTLVKVAANSRHDGGEIVVGCKAWCIRSRNCRDVVEYQPENVSRLHGG